MRSASIYLGWLLLLSPAKSVLAAETTDGASRIARDARSGARAAREFKLESLQLDQPTIKLTIGGASDKDESDSKTLTTPFDWSYKTAGNDWWKFQIAGDAYTRVTTPGLPTLDGVADLKFNVIRQILPSVLATTGISVPTNGNVGTQTYTQHARLLVTNDVGAAWSYVAFMDLKHYNGVEPRGSAFRTTAYLELDYNIDKSKTVLVNISRTRRAGAGASTEVGLEFDSPSPWSAVTSAVSISRGLSSGFRHTGVEVDFTYKF